MIEFLRPEQAVDIVIARVRKRIQVLTDTKIDGYLLMTDGGYTAK